MTKNEKKVVSQKELTTQLSKVRSAINLKINEIVAGDVNKEKKTIEGGLDVYSALKNNLVDCYHSNLFFYIYLYFLYYLNFLHL